MEPPSNQQIITFKPALVKDIPTSDTSSLAIPLPEAAEGTPSSVPESSGTQSPSKRKLAATRKEGPKLKKAKKDDKQARFINPIPQQMATARSQSKKAQSNRDKKAHQKRQSLSHPGIMPLKGDNIAQQTVASEGPVGIIANLKRPWLDHEESSDITKALQDSPERKRRSVVRNTSTSSSNFTFHSFRHVTAAPLEPDVQHLAASEAISTSVDVFDDTPLPVLDHG